nr:MAG TPA_asm: hypothetical protein [Caudoviricetes sp.]
MGADILENIINKTTSFVFYMKSGSIWKFDSENISVFEYKNDVVCFRFKNSRMLVIMNKEIESVSLILKEDEKSE